MRAISRLALFGTLLGSSALVACGGGEKPAADTAAAPAPAAVAPPAATVQGPLEPDAGGKVITVTMSTDDKGNNRFTPSEVEAKKGDVVRFTLGTGVHNVNFVADSNPNRPMPPASALLQLPGQTHDVKVIWEPGTYFFQCDPHALLGMVGHLIVK